jgi:hypothetical protein
MAPSSRTLFRTPRAKSSVDTGEVRRSSVGSWMGLLAAATLGVPGASTVRAQVRADMALSDGRPYRLVVQSYDPSVGIGGDVPSGRAKPLASMQRPVTAEEMKEGVRVDLLELGQVAVSSDDAARGNLAKALVLAWVEEGRADLEFDGRRARPMPGSYVGAARRRADQGSVSIDIKSPVAA